MSDVTSVKLTRTCHFKGSDIFRLLSLNSFPPERAVMQRERSEGSYRLTAYFLGKILSEIPFILIYPIIFIAICYFMVQLR